MDEVRDGNHGNTGNDAKLRVVKRGYRGRDDVLWLAGSTTYRTYFIASQVSATSNTKHGMIEGGEGLHCQLHLSIVNLNH